MTSSSSSSSSLLFVSSSLTAEAAYDEIVSVANFRELTFDSPRLVTDNLKFASETSSESSSDIKSVAKENIIRQKGGVRLNIL